MTSTTNRLPVVARTVLGLVLLLEVVDAFEIDVAKRPSARKGSTYGTSTR
jgi:hypothetical protein